MRLKELWDSLLHSGMGSFSIFRRLKMSPLLTVVINLKAPLAQACHVLKIIFLKLHQQFILQVLQNNSYGLIFSASICNISICVVYHLCIMKVVDSYFIIVVRIFILRNKLIFLCQHRFFREYFRSLWMYLL